MTISGGNPALLKQLDAFIELLKENNIRAALETQGTVYQDWFTLIDDLTISPKPPSSKMVTNFQKLDHILTSLQENDRQHAVSLKVVIFNDEDLEFAKMVHKRYPGIPFYLQVGNDDVHTTDDQSLITHLLGKYEALVDKVAGDAELNLVRVLPCCTHCYGATNAEYNRKEDEHDDKKRIRIRRCNIARQPRYKLFVRICTGRAGILPE